MVSGGIAKSGLIRHYFVFGGTLSTYNYDCTCDGHETFGTPQYVYEEITVPGRHGKLYYDTGRFENTEIKYSMFFTDMREFRDFVNKLLSFRGYQRLEDSHHPGEYRLALLTSQVELEVSGYDNEYCSLELTFTVKPQRFLLSGENELNLTTLQQVYNPTLYPAKPLLKVYCSSSSSSFNLNGYQVQIASGNTYSYICLDCESEDAYSGTNNCNGMIACEEFPILDPGDNQLIRSSGISKIILIPRWWRV